MNNFKRLIQISLMIIVMTMVHRVEAQEINPNGYNRFYFDNGVVSSEGNLKDGKPEGYWKNYYESGILKSEGNRENFALAGTWNFYSPEGVLVESIQYENGMRSGVTKRYSTEGFLESSTLYAEDVKQGKSYTYYTSGAVKTETTFEDGAENGKAFEFNEKGDIITITTYRNGIFIKQEKINRRDDKGRKQGTWKSFYDDGTVKAEGKFSNDRKNGYWKEYSKGGDLEITYKFDKGKIITDAEELADLEIREQYYPDSDGKIKFRGTFREGKAHGTHIWYALDGNIDSAKVFRNGALIAEGNLTTDGLRIGDWREYYYPNGELKAVGSYERGYRVGEWNYFFENGQKQQVGKYNAKGLPTGKWLWYYDHGGLLREETFENGEENGWLIEYGDSGQVITRGEYVSGLEEGEWFFEIGDHLEKGVYEAGLRQGVWKHYFISNGALRFEGAFYDDLPQDKHTWYYDTGVKRLEGKYVSGIKEGEWRRYNPDGSVFVTIEYNSGQEIKVDGLKLRIKSSEEDSNGE